MIDGEIVFDGVKLSDGCEVVLLFLVFGGVFVEVVEVFGVVRDIVCLMIELFIVDDVVCVVVVFICGVLFVFFGNVCNYY